MPEATPPTPKPENTAAPPSDPVLLEKQAITRRSFAVAGITAALGLGGWQWLRTRELDDGIPWPLRRMLRFNERLASAYFDANRLAPNFPLTQAGEPRVNGEIGLSGPVEQWKLAIHSPGNAPLSLGLAEIKALPRQEMITELKCIEGWSVPVHWGGARLIDLATRYRLGTRSGNAPDPKGKPDDLVPYVGFETPDKKYYVGLDVASAFHPQTLLCYEMDSKSLLPAHGGPLRLVIPVKYGIKNIKRIGTITFSDVRPRDYWAERGYDWYAGH
jgi:DMSO/TMAO reductase YedYZ molybdopterin-dependent catalytic subunit